MTYTSHFQCYGININIDVLAIYTAIFIAKNSTAPGVWWQCVIAVDDNIKSKWISNYVFMLCKSEKLHISLDWQKKSQTDVQVTPCVL